MCNRVGEGRGIDVGLRRITISLYLAGMVFGATGGIVGLADDIYVSWLVFTLNLAYLGHSLHCSLQQELPPYPSDGVRIVETLCNRVGGCRGIDVGLGEEVHPSERKGLVSHSGLK
jgi:hypothetical protein